MAKVQFPYPDSLNDFRNQLLHWLKGYDTFCFLDSCDFYNKETKGTHPYYHAYELLVGAGVKEELVANYGNAFEQLKAFTNQSSDWIFGHFGYDLKNELENLSSQRPDAQQNSDLHFFKASIVIAVSHEGVAIYGPSNDTIYKVWESINALNHCIEEAPIKAGKTFKARISKASYESIVESIIGHIIEGDVYEMNFCQDFFAEQTDLDPFALYRNLKQISPAPFSCFYKTGPHHLISASMERFLKKQNQQLISQPIKGTIRRGGDTEEDKYLKSSLYNDPKERAENVMIVDLVRNDLAKSALTGSVEVEELFGVYPFPAVYQMISTVSAHLSPHTHFIDAIKNAFPMGSMTGAPKVKAMELIENYESFKRGVFSGAVGYIAPDGDFDFNVVIRSFLYNEFKKHLSIPVGSAITYEAEPAKEYEECLTKIQKLTKALNPTMKIVP